MTRGQYIALCLIGGLTVALAIEWWQLSRKFDSLVDMIEAANK